MLSEIAGLRSHAPPPGSAIRASSGACLDGAALKSDEFDFGIASGLARSRWSRVPRRRREPHPNRPRSIKSQMEELLQLPAKRKPEPFTGGEGTGTLLWGVARATRAAVRRLYNVDNERNAAWNRWMRISAISPSIRFERGSGE